MELLEKHFEIALETPDGIKKLRELILSLAMQGKLVPQDPKDQPAIILLKEIENKKKQVIKAGHIRNREIYAPVKKENTPYELPNGWEWVRLGIISQFENGDRSKRYPNDNDLKPSGIPFFGAKDMIDGILRFDNELRFIAFEKFKELSSGKLADGDFVFLLRGTVGKMAIFTSNEKYKTGFINAQMIIVRTFLRALNPFLQKYFISRTFEQMIYNNTTGSAIKQMPANALKSFLIPIPPLAEQKRIVAKIDQLMALCNKLEEERNERNSKRTKVHNAAINKLLTASDKPEFKKSWSFITKNFGELYSVPENVEELKKAILQLAVMGKLVPQDPYDPPAGELIKEIETAKSHLIKESRIKRQDPLQISKLSNIPYELPNGWTWTRLGDNFSLKSGNTFNAADELSSGKYFYIKVADMNKPGNDIMITETNIFLSETKNVINALIPANSIIFPKRGGAIATNKKRIVSFPICVDTNIMAITCPEQIDIMFAYNWLLTVDLALLNTGTSVPQINNKDIAPLLFPLPPLAEQKRIVAKIDQLMGFCNNLKQQLNDYTQKKTAILNSVLHKY